MNGIFDQGEVSATNIAVASSCDILRSGLSALIRAAFIGREALTTDSWTSATAMLRREGNIDLLVVTDDLLGGDNRRAIQQLRHGFPHVRIVVVGMSSNRATVLATIAAGAHGYLPSSMPMKDMAEALFIVLAGRLFVPDLVAAVPADFEDGGAEQRTHSLTQRQHQVLKLLSGGASNKEIARQLSLTESTVKVHMGGLFRVLGVRSRTAAVATASGLSL